MVAAIRETVPDLRLVKVGGEWTADHLKRIARLGLAAAITHVGGLNAPNWLTSIAGRRSCWFQVPWKDSDCR